MRIIEFNNPVYSDAGLTTEINDQLRVSNSTSLPVLSMIDGVLTPITVFYSAIAYRATGYALKQDGTKGNKLYHVDFIYPAGVTNNEITTGEWDA